MFFGMSVRECVHAFVRAFFLLARCLTIGGGAATPIGHWRSGSETDTPTMSFGVRLFEHRPLRRYFLLQLLIEY